MLQKYRTVPSTARSRLCPPALKPSSRTLVRVVGRGAGLGRKQLCCRAFKDWDFFSSFTATKPALTETAPKPAAPPKRDFLEARQVSLFSLFDSDAWKFDIPMYQRSYSWRTRHCFELLQDFVRAYHARSEYFLGAVVTTRAEDGPHVPFQVIDGQQRLTTLFILLSCLHAWARQQDNEGLQQRIRRMLYIDADTLDPSSTGRYRLNLREGDDAFFRANMLDDFLPTRYAFSGLAATQQQAAAGAEAALLAELQAAAAAAAVQDSDCNGDGANGAGVVPLENETHWRMYENALFIRQQLSHLVDSGLNLQEFVFHCLRNCYVVVMTARDESASFSIFSTLNGRGMDLSVVDKLKAEMLQGLEPGMRDQYAEAWADMENVLGRPTFHRVFDYIRELAALQDPAVQDTTLLEYFTRKLDDPNTVRRVMDYALAYARLLLQLKQCSWKAAPAEGDDSTTADGHSNGNGVSVVPQTGGKEETIMFTFDTPSHTQSHSHDAGAVAAATSVAVAVAADSSAGMEAATASYGLALVADGTDSPAALTAAETTEPFAATAGAAAAAITSLQQEAGVGMADEVEGPTDIASATTALADGKVARAAGVEALHHQQAGEPGPHSHPHQQQQHQAEALQAELNERSRFVNLFTDDCFLPPLLEFFYQEEDIAMRVQFLKLAEALQLYLELEGDAANKSARWAAIMPALTARPMDSAGVLAAMELTPAERVAFKARLDSKDLMYSGSEARTIRHLLLRCEPSEVCATTDFASLIVEKVAPQAAPEGSLWRKTRIYSTLDPSDPYSVPPPPISIPATVPAAAAMDGADNEDAAGASSPSSSSGAGDMQQSAAPVQTYEVRYWYEVQRMFWHAKLGNLILLPSAASSAALSPHGLATADYDTKAAAWRAAGVPSRLPAFSGPVVMPDGRYGRFKFCFDECKQRHADMMTRLITLFEL